MGFFDDLIKKVAPSVLPAPVQQVVEQVAPQILDSDIIKDAMQGIGQQVKDQSISGIQVPGFLESAGNYVKDIFTDDPNSGWYDTWNQSGMRNAQGEYEAMQQKQLDDLRNAQGQYEQSLQPSAISEIYQNALKKAGGFLGSDVGKNVMSGGANIAASLIGLNQAKKGQEQQQAAYNDALRKVQEAQLTSGEAFNALKDDPSQLAYRAQALQGLSDRASMGLTPEDQAALNEIRRQSQNQFKANNATISQNMARRGFGNSGLALAQSMGAADQAAQQQAVAGDRQAALNFQAKQAALQNLGNQSENALQGDFTRQLGKATNLSAVDKFNAQQKTNAAQNAAAIQQGLGDLQAQNAAGKGAATGAIGQVVGSVLNPNKNK